LVYFTLPATSEIYTLSLHDALPISVRALGGSELLALDDVDAIAGDRDAEHALFDLYNRCFVEKSTMLFADTRPPAQLGMVLPDLDRKSTRLNSSHGSISYAVFCLKK